jgi:DNA-binding transcriptional LysR family regulator
MIDAQRLATFRAVARAGSLARAARALHLTPSAVSQQMAALERQTRSTLLERSTRGIALTAAGQALLETAESIHAELSRAERLLDQLRSDGPPSLTVATFASAGAHLLAPALSRLTDDPARQPVITVIEAEPADAITALRNGNADLALVFHFHTPKPPAYWFTPDPAPRYTPLHHDELHLVLPDDHSLTHARTADLTDIATVPWIHGWADTGDALDTVATTLGIAPITACRSSDYRFMQHLVAAGVGAAFVPTLALEYLPQTHTMALTPTIARHIGVLTPHHRTPNAQALEHTLRTIPLSDGTAAQIAD